MSNKNVGAAASDFLPLRTTEAEEETAAASLSCLSIYLSALLGSVCGVAWAGCCRARGRCRPSQGEILRRYFQFQDAAECRNGMSTGERGIEFTRPTRQHCGGGRWRPLRKIWTGSGTDMIPAVFARDTMKLLLSSRTSLHLAEVWSG